MITEQHGAAAARLFDARRLRNAIFGVESDGFGEPGWDMLLALTILDAKGLPLSRETMLSSSAVPAAIAERFLQWLSSRALIATSGQSGGDYVLTQRGRALMAAYLEQAL